MAFAFDPNYYMTHRSDVLNAYVLAGAEPGTGMKWAAFAEYHFNLHGWKEGSNPNTIFVTSEYLAANPDVMQAGVNPFQHYLLHGVYEGRAPNASFPKLGVEFDAAAYLEANPDLGEAGIDTPEAAYAHYVLHGQFEDRPGTPAGGVPGGSQTLTTGFDNLVGTANDDLFLAPLHYGADVQVQTLTSGDKIDGGAGRDRIEAQLRGNVTTPEISNVEELSFRAFAGGAGPNEVDARLISGAELVENYRSDDHLEVRNLQNIVALAVVENNDGTDTLLRFENTVLAGDADETTITFQNSEDVGDVALVAQTSANGFETLNIVVEGEADFATVVNSVQGGATLATINIDNQSADHDFIINNALDGVTTVDASASVGGVNVSLDVDEDVTVTGGEGDDHFRFGAGLDRDDTVDGGDGYDTLYIRGAAIGNNLNVSNVEQLVISVSSSSSTYNMNNFGAGEASIERIRLEDTFLLDDITLNNVNKGVAIELTDYANSVTIDVPDAANPGSNADVLDLGLDGDLFAIGTITANAIETINLDSVGTNGHTIATLDANLLRTLNITGDEDLTITNAVGGSTIELVDASAFTGDLDITVGDGRGGTDANTRSDDVGVEIRGGAGNNFIVAGDFNDEIITQGGDDTITGGQGADIITTGAGRDVIVYTTYLDSSLEDAGGANDASATFLGIDHVTDFQAGSNGDRFSFSAFGLNANAADVIQSASIVSSTNAALADQLTALDGGALDFTTYAFAVVTVAGGEAAGTYLLADSNNDQAFDAADDIVINITGITGTLEAGNFIL